MGLVRNSADAPALKSWLTQPLVIGLLTMLIFSLLALFTLMGFAEQRASQEAQRQAERLGNSVQVILNPLVLADDRVSMNYIANQLVADPVLSGIKLTDQNRLTLAIAGSPSEYVVTREFSPNGERLGELTLWVDPVPGLQALKSQLFLTGAAFLISVLIGFIAYKVSLRLANRTEPTPFAETLRQELSEPELPTDSHTDTSEPFAEEPDTDQAPETQSEIAEDAEVSEEDSDQIPEFPEPKNESEPAREEDADPDAPISFSDLDPKEEDEIVRSNLESWLTDQAAARAEETSETDDAISVHPALQQPDVPVPTLKSYVATQVKNPDEEPEVDLIELLRPEHDSDTMPKFVPSPMKPEDSESLEEPESEEIEIISPVAQPTTPKSRKLPIITEEQLDLYTLEQELDLMLPASEAGYLILIDSTSAHSAHLELEEARQIRRTYRTLANSVARIYHGEVGAIGEDIEIRFANPDEEDHQGINAICAALLFNILYRSYNQSRIKQMAPVLNLHIALVRGQVQRFTQLLDEARFLTRSTQTNHLISHTALTEATELKTGLLEDADLKREDEDKVLIVKVEKRHQTLLEKQARYLLAKLAERASKPTE